MSVWEVVWLEAWGKGLSAAGNAAWVQETLQGPGWSEHAEAFLFIRKDPDKRTLNPSRGRTLLTE